MPSPTPDNTDMPETMRAWTFTRKGLPTPDLLKLSNVPRPIQENLAPNEVLIKVHYTGIKPLYARAIMPKFPHLTSRPWTPEIDYSGTVEAIGSSVNDAGKRLQVGDEVFGSLDPPKYLWYGGTAREYIVLPADLAVKVPVNMDLKHAAALGANASTVVQFLNALKPRLGDKILVTAASGSLGTMLIPALRAQVGTEGKIMGICSGSNAERVKSLGADEVIDYTVTTDLAGYLKSHHSTEQFDTVVDIAGVSDDLYIDSPTYLKRDGIYLFAGMVNTTHDEGGILSVLTSVIRLRIKLFTPVILGGVPRKSLFISGKLNRHGLEAVKSHAEKGMLRVDVAKVWEMEELVDAYGVMLSDATNAARGNHVLHVQD